MSGAGWGISIVLTIISVIVISITKCAGYFEDWDDLLEGERWRALFRRPATYLALLTLIMSAEHYAVHDGNTLLFTSLLGLDKTMGKFPTVNPTTIVVGIIALLLFIGEIVHINTHPNDYPDLDTYGNGGAVWFMLSLCCLNILPGTLVASLLDSVFDFQSAPKAEIGTFEIGSFVPVLIGAAVILLGLLITPRRDRGVFSSAHGPFTKNKYSDAQLGPLINIVFLAAQLLFALFYRSIFELSDAWGPKIPAIIIGVFFKDNYSPLKPWTWTIRMYIIIIALIVYIVHFYKEFGHKTPLLVGRTVYGLGIFYTLFMFSEFLRAHNFGWLGGLLELLMGISIAISVIMWIYGLFGETMDEIAKPINDSGIFKSHSDGDKTKPYGASGLTWPREIMDMSTMRILYFVREDGDSQYAVYSPTGGETNSTPVANWDIGLIGRYRESHNGQI